MEHETEETARASDRVHAERAYIDRLATAIQPLLAGQPLRAGVAYGMAATELATSMLRKPDLVAKLAAVDAATPRPVATDAGGAP